MIDVCTIALLLLIVLFGECERDPIARSKVKIKSRDGGIGTAHMM